MVMNFASNLWDFMVGAFIIFLFIMWIWLLISVLGDLFRRNDVSGVGKVAWTVGLLFFPYIGVFVYLLTQSTGMTQREVDRVGEMRDHLRSTIGFSVADELTKLKTLEADGVITADEHAKMRARLV